MLQHSKALNLGEKENGPVPGAADIFRNWKQIYISE